MRILKKITLGEGMKILSEPELKHLKGGTNPVYCHCKAKTGEGTAASSCDGCSRICNPGTVQNCNYVTTI